MGFTVKREFDEAYEKSIKDRFGELNPNNLEGLREVECIPLSEYCKRTGETERSVRYRLECGQLEGIQIGCNWFLPENTEGAYILKSPVPKGYITLAAWCEANQTDFDAIRKLAANSRIPEAVNIGGCWFLPKDLMLEK